MPAGDGGGRFRDANWARILDVNQSRLEKELESAKLSANASPQQIEQLEADLSAVMAAKQEIVDSEAAAAAQKPADNKLRGAVSVQFKGKRSFKDSWIELDGSELAFRKGEGLVPAGGL